jgi:hypothetical protein
MKWNEIVYLLLKTVKKQINADIFLLP